MSINHKREIVIKNGRNRKTRAKSFTSEEKATAWAKENDIKKFHVEKLNEGLSKKYVVKEE